MDVDEDPDPVMQPSGSPAHPIKISSGSASYAGSPYQGPNDWDKYWNQFTFVYTPSYHSPSPPPPTPQEDVYMEPVEHPQPPPAMEQPQPPPEPPRRKPGACMFVRLGPWSSPLPPTYPPIPKDPQMGGPSNTTPVVDLTLVTFAQPPPPLGFDNPIPTYPATSGYNPFVPSPSIDINCQVPPYDPYL
ncbi:hypothetical protein Hanom_Chr12g01174441 [Helianthus anomalus]